jgi:hypothetical protein
MVGIIKTLADDPLKKPDPPKFIEEEVKKESSHMRTVELEKTIY